MNTYRAYATIAILLSLVVGALWFVIQGAPGKMSKIKDEANTPAKQPSPEIIAYLAQSKGFQYLVSYTQRGFEPRSLDVKSGETVRFINNSKEELWVSSTGEGGIVYPGAGSECGQSAFDTCKSIQNGEFWEFEFIDTGTWSYQNNSNPGKTGEVTVR